MATISARAGITLGVVLVLALDGAAVIARTSATSTPAATASARSAALGAAQFKGEEPNVVTEARASVPGGAVVPPVRPSAPADLPARAPTKLPHTSTSTTTTMDTRKPGTTTTAPPRSAVDGVGLYVVSVDGTDVRHVSGEFGEFSWSPDGRRLTHSYGGALRIVGADGSGATTVAGAGVGVLDPAWSPDGRRIAFHRSGGGVYVVSVDGSSPAVLVEPAAYMATWTADGRLVVITPELVGVQSSLLIFDHDGTRRVLARGARNEVWPTASPDGRLVAYMTERLMVVGVDGSPPRPVTDACCALVRANNSQMSWSPDSRRLAFFYYGDVWIVDVAGGGSRVLIPGADYPTWSPDGRRLAVVNEQETRPDGRLRMSVQLVGADGSDRHTILDPGEFAAYGTEWSPTARHIAFKVGTGVLPTF